MAQKFDEKAVVLEIFATAGVHSGCQNWFFSDATVQNGALLGRLMYIVVSKRQSVLAPPCRCHCLPPKDLVLISGISCGERT